MDGQLLRQQDQIERRRRPRFSDFSTPLAEIRFPDAPIYVLKVRDLSSEGAGIVVRPDSTFLELIRIGQILTIGVILPVAFKGPSGILQSKVEHITEILDGPFHGHILVGVSFLKKASAENPP